MKLWNMLPSYQNSKHSMVMEQLNPKMFRGSVCVRASFWLPDSSYNFKACGEPPTGHAEARRQCKKQRRTRRCHQQEKKLIINLFFRTKDFHERRCTSRLPTRRLGVSLIGEEAAIDGDWRNSTSIVGRSGSFFLNIWRNFIFFIVSSTVILLWFGISILCDYTSKEDLLHKKLLLNRGLANK